MCFTDIDDILYEKRDRIIKNLRERMDEIPLLEDIVEELSEIKIGDGKNVKVTIVKQDFKKCENTTYEKILK